MSKFSALGKAAELEFNLISLRRGYATLWPSIDIHKYDCVVDSGHRLFKVQVKSTTKIRNTNRGYKVYKFSTATGKHGRGKYDRSDFDFFAFYHHLTRQWWIVPIEEIPENSRSISIYPERNSKYNKFLNAWHLLD